MAPERITTFNFMPRLLTVPTFEVNSLNVAVNKTLKGVYCPFL